MLEHFAWNENCGLFYGYMRQFSGSELQISIVINDLASSVPIVMIMGGNAETMYKAGRAELMGEAVAFMKRNGLAAGVAAHILAIPKAIDALKAEPDFYLKTVNNVGYESETPSEVAAYLTECRKPCIGFKVLGAGRTKPREGFDLAFRSGADFINVGMYDFQFRN